MDKENLQIQKLDGRVLCPWDQTVCPLPLENVEGTQKCNGHSVHITKNKCF